MENYPNYLEYLHKNGGWFKMWAEDCKPCFVGYASEVSPSILSEFAHIFVTPLVFSYMTKELYVNTKFLYEEEKEFLGKPSIEDINLIKDKLNKKRKNFNVKTKEILVRKKLLK